MCYEATGGPFWVIGFKSTGIKNVFEVTAGTQEGSVQNGQLIRKPTVMAV